jgi:hypothetical protein
VLVGAISISIWYRLDRALSTGECIPLAIHGNAGAGASNNDIYAINLIPPDLVLYSETGNQIPIPLAVAAPPIAFTVDEWHHLVGVRGPTGNVVFHVDAVGTLGVAGVLPSNGSTGHLRIGADVEVSMCTSFPGALDELYVYPRALTQDEVTKLYDAGR